MVWRGWWVEGVAGEEGFVEEGEPLDDSHLFCGEADSIRGYLHGGSGREADALKEGVEVVGIAGDSSENGFRVRHDDLEWDWLKHDRV